MLNIIAVSGDRLCLDTVCAFIHDTLPDARIERFFSAQEAYDRLTARGECDVLFVDVAMEDGKGLTLARRARMADPALNVVCLAADGTYAADAMELHASGYLVQPLTLTVVKRELDDLRYVPGQKNEAVKRVRAQCFGNFELFVEDRKSVV